MKKLYHFRVFAYPSLAHICDVGTESPDPQMYDPRIEGDGNVIWQPLDESESLSAHPKTP